ncbi:hypothetical protein [Sphingobacterium siyangense]|uniref:hypothetical protein n=1 Tax=Sphingobacterium siyangense TaxID=459529 RepID=UPI001963EF0D|nr:hypothetical protein [Sphingobacterium siyangense]QRY55571.1 hypothetical protein JVX97_16145 [Sphingobacterium siyangense]
MIINDTFSGTSHDMSSPYPLEFFDLLLTFTLNPKKNDLGAITAQDVAAISEQIDIEEETVRILLKKRTFSLSSEDSMRMLIERYHSALILLLDSFIAEGRNHQSPILKLAFDAVVSSIDRLLSFIESHYTKYVKMDLRAPATYLSAVKWDLKERLRRLSPKLEAFRDLASCHIVLGFLENYVSSNGSAKTFHALIYAKELTCSLESLEWNFDSARFPTPLDALLFQLDFNSKAYLDHLQSSVMAKTDECQTDSAKLEAMLLCQKQFRQLYISPRMTFDTDEEGIQAAMERWFGYEITYLDRMIDLSLLQGSESMAASTQKTSAKVSQKVLCMLSTDQMGLILRAADESRILVAKSMNQVFRSIVPHLSTPYKEDLSYDGMRSKSYVAEDKDKQKAVEALERIIKKIQEY